ncbi:MAG: hypothetical protein AAF847_19250, partial [Bacteroidota bacterium]
KMKFKNIYLLSLLSLALLSSCIENELAFDVIESPVLAIFDEMEAEEGMLKIQATFYELDKSGILDQNIGIDSTAISGMTVGVYVEESVLIQEYTTDASGIIVFDKPLEALGGNTRLEWVGNYKDTPFRIYKKF